MNLNFLAEIPIDVWIAGVLALSLLEARAWSQRVLNLPGRFLRADM